MQYEILRGVKAELEDTIQGQLDKGWLLHGQTFMTGVWTDTSAKPTSDPEIGSEPTPEGDDKAQGVASDPIKQDENKPAGVAGEIPFKSIPPNRFGDNLEPQFGQAMICHDNAEDEEA